MSSSTAAPNWVEQEALAGASADLAGLWGLRPDVRTHLQGSHDAIFRAEDTSHVSQVERLAAARAAAAASGASDLADAYGRELTDPVPDTARSRAIVAFAERLAAEPVRVSGEDYDTLRAAGLSEQGLVTVTLLVGFVTYQVRALAGLATLGGAR